MRIPSGHRFGCIQAGGHREARDWHADLDETFSTKPGAPHPHQSLASSCRYPYVLQTHPQSLILPLFALHILRTEIWRDFIPSLQDTAREDMVLLVWHRGNVFEFHIHEKRNPKVGIVVIRVAQSTHLANPTKHRCPSRTWVGPMRSQSNNDCTGFIYEYIPILCLFVGIPHQYLQSDHDMQSSHSQLQPCHLHLVAEPKWFRPRGTVSTPKPQGQLRPGHKLSMEAQRQRLTACVR